MQQTPSYSMDDVEESQISRLALTVEKGQTKTRLIWVVGKEQRNGKSSTTLEKAQTKTGLISLLGNWYKIEQNLPKRATEMPEKCHHCRFLRKWEPQEKKKGREKMDPDTKANGELRNIT